MKYTAQQKKMLKAIEDAAYYGEKNRLKKEKDLAKTQGKIPNEAANEAARRGIAKARGKVYISTKTKTRAKKVGGFLARVGKQAAKNIAESQMTDAEREKYKKNRQKQTASAKKREKPPQTKTISGKIYKLTGHVNTKRKAEVIKNQEKQSGYNVRIIKSADFGYLVYRRR